MVAQNFSDSKQVLRVGGFRFNCRGAWRNTSGTEVIVGHRKWEGIVEWGCAKQGQNIASGASGTGVGYGNNNMHPKSGIIPVDTERRSDRERSDAAKVSVPDRIG